MYERSNLELSIQSHLARASRLSDELSYIRSINIELKRRVSRINSICVFEHILCLSINVKVITE